MVPDSIAKVETSRCPSGRKYDESRMRFATADGCTDQTETRQVCKLLQCSNSMCIAKSVTFVQGEKHAGNGYTIDFLQLFKW